MLPYIPSPKLKMTGFLLFCVGILGCVAIGLYIQHSGKVVASGKLTTKLPEVPLPLQKILAEGQAKFNNKLIEYNTPLLDRKDTIETVNIAFTPVHLTPAMGEIAIIMDIDWSGYVLKDGQYPRKLGKQNYTLTNIKTGHVDFDDHVQGSFFGQSSDASFEQEQILPKIKNNAGHVSGVWSKVIGYTTVSEEGEYILSGNLQKLKLGMPMTDIKLSIKTGMIKQGVFVKPIILLIVLSLIGFMMGIIATSPEDRAKGIKRRQQRGY